LLARCDPPRARTRSYVPLLRQTMGIFQEPLFSELLAPCLDTLPSSGNGTPGALDMVPQVAVEWLRDGGKRLRPFATIVAFALARHGLGILSGAEPPAEGLVPPAVKRIALAIESMHKASLVHDDIEDEDEFRYGRQTLHCIHGIGPAVNVGDYLIGVGYRLITSAAPSLGADCACDILAALAHAHLELCRGQGAELLWQKEPDKARRPLDVLTVYALKTAPAFEAALYAGLRAAGARPDADLLHQFSCCIGEGFQIMNDLEDWRADDRNKLTRGRDAILGRPTILRAFATEADTDGRLAQLVADAGSTPAAELVNRLAAFYEQSGAMARAEQLLGKLRVRALACAARFDTVDLQELMAFLVRLVLPDKTPALPPGHP
jgi:geranylgeranyl diphosphate synthase, type II